MIKQDFGKNVSNWNIANYLTFFRIIIVPFFVWAFFHNIFQFNNLRLGVALIFAIAAITDKIDGFIARRKGLITKLGKIADPLADKILMSSALICLSISHEISWIITIVILLREIIVTCLRSIALRKNIVYTPSYLGKVKTVLQLSSLFLLLLPLKSLLGVVGNSISWMILYFAILFTVITGIVYIQNILILIIKNSNKK